MHSAARAGDRGGWGHALARQAMAGAIGLELDLGGASTTSAELRPGRGVVLRVGTAGFLVTVAGDAGRFEQHVRGLPLPAHRQRRRRGPPLEVRAGSATWLDVDVEQLKRGVQGDAGR